MAYSELIKNFDKIRSYMKEFYIFGFKTREELNRKSARTYDDERRRIQSYLGDAVSFGQTASGKNLYISLDGREITHNPLYKAFKSKSFTNRDITFHFIVLDILADERPHSLKEILDVMWDEYLCNFEEPFVFDESTLRKKLKEYVELGIVEVEKEGRNVLYKIVKDNIDISKYQDAIRFFTEEDVLGVVGSYLEDKMELQFADNRSVKTDNGDSGKPNDGDTEEIWNGTKNNEKNQEEYLSFKNHYIMNAYDTEIMEKLLIAIYEKRQIIFRSITKYNQEVTWKIIPLKVYISTDGGRNYLMGMTVNGKTVSFRNDYIQTVRLLDVEDNYEKYLDFYKKSAGHIWGVAWKSDKGYQHIEIDINVEKGEEHIIRRLKREKRCGTLSCVDDNTWRITADVCDSYEMITWIRTFMGRIKRVKCSNPELVNQLKYDVVHMSKQYEVM